MHILPVCCGLVESFNKVTFSRCTPKDKLKGLAQSTIKIKENFENLQMKSRQKVAAPFIDQQNVFIQNVEPPKTSNTTNLKKVGKPDMRAVKRK